MPTLSSCQNNIKEVLNMHYTLSTLSRGITLALGFGLLAPSLHAAPNPIKVDQFGYLPNAQKIAVISNPVNGFNNTSPFSPNQSYELRSAADNSVIFSANLTPWKDGATDATSGDQAWWFDFSQITNSGEYYILDPLNGTRSENFRIDSNVYHDVLKQAVRSFFYQRSGIAKQPPYADTRWSDEASHTADAHATLIDPNNPERVIAGTERDLSGGWYDAGDFNKYVNYADGALHNLLFAYQESSQVWGDDYNIPESGNGVPDLLDEIKWELDWLLKMQNSDGSVLHKVSSLSHYIASSYDANGNPIPDFKPSNDTNQRRYAPATASATISAAGAYAHAATVYKGLSDPAMQAYGEQLLAAAERAWVWLEDNPDKIPSRFGENGSRTGFYTADAEDCHRGDCAGPQKANRLAAAIYLFGATGNAKYHTYIQQHTAPGSSDIRFLRNLDQAYLRVDGLNTEMQDALLYYTSLSGSDSALVTKIKQSYSDAMVRPISWGVFSPLARFQEQEDPYQAYHRAEDYHWGSNRAKGHAGNMLMSARVYQTETGNQNAYYNAASGYLHYLHGTNPLGQNYLTNMGEFGADNSVAEIHHQWFADNSQWDNANSDFGPAPGFLTGGPNPKYPETDSTTAQRIRSSVTIDGISLLVDQPTSKTYKAWNTGNEAPWQINENSITYQAPYVRLISKFMVDAPVGVAEKPTTPGTSTPAVLPPDTIVPNIEIVTTSQWDDGYCIAVTISTDKSINDWQFDLQLPGPTFGIWGVNSSDQGSNRFNITPASWNHLIFAGDQKSFDSCGAGDPAQISVQNATGHTYQPQMRANFGSLFVDAWFTGIWDNSYCMDVNITNLTNSTLKWSEVRLTLEDSVLDVGWSGYYQMSGNQLLITPKSWNASLAPGGDTTVGFCADGHNNLSLTSAVTGQ
ncbi:endoglucanase [Candidatus Endoriftia persephone str. Guaymas]|nr:endoglucanase [Candidatus Endoriftia persephone str. Guaymas]